MLDDDRLIPADAKNAGSLASLFLTALPGAVVGEYAASYSNVILQRFKRYLKLASL